MGLKLFDIVPEFSNTYNFTLFFKVIVSYLLSFLSTCISFSDAMCQIQHQNRSPAVQNVCAKTQTYIRERNTQFKTKKTLTNHNFRFGLYISCEIADAKKFKCDFIKAMIIKEEQSSLHNAAINTDKKLIKFGRVLTPFFTKILIYDNKFYFKLFFFVD